MLKTLKRWLPALLAAAIGLAYYAYTTHQATNQIALTQAVGSGILAADSPLIAAARNTEVLPFGMLTGKFIFGAGLFFGGIGLVWFVLRFIMPVLPRWATGRGIAAGGAAGQPGYAEALGELRAPWRLAVFTAVWLALLFYFAACVLAACLVS